MANSSDSPAISSYDDTMALSVPSGGAAAAAPPELLAGRYAIVGMLGAGGMGTVYRARDTELDEVVALKVLRRDLVGDSDALERFRREVKLARRVTHKNVARTFDIGEHQGDRFLTMELVAGEALSSLLARSRPSAAEVAEIAAHVCDGLEAAHIAGVIHRDLKPDNVLIGGDGRVVITDFGIARAYSADGAEQTLGMVVGTPAYMAPEQVDGSADIDARTDIYAFGAMLFEMWTGQRAWPGDSPFVVASARLHSPPPDPRARSRAITDDQAALVIRCMARLPADRFPSVAEVRAELVRIVSQLPSGLPSIPPRGSTVSGLGGGSSLAPSAASRLALDALLASSEPAPGDKSVAVLSFRNLGSPSDAYLAEGLTEDLIDGLSATGGLSVTPRSAVLAVPADLEPREIGHRLSAQVVVEGTVRRSGGRVRINARVIAVADGYQLWAQRFDGSDADLFAINDEVARSVATVLTVAPSDRPARVAPTNPEAIDLYLRARAEYQRFWKSNTVASIELFERALALAPDDPMILSGYALACVRRQFFGGSSATFDQRAEDAAHRAIAIAPRSGDARLAMGSLLFYQGDVRGALREVRDAIRANPNLAEAHGLFGRILVEVGSPDDGMRSLRTALALDPSQSYVRRECVRVQALLGQWEEADRALEENEEAEPGENWMQRVRLMLWRPDRSLALRLAAGMIDSSTSPEGNLLATAVLRTVIDGAVFPTMLAYRAWISESARAYRLRSFICQMATEAFAYVGDDDKAMEALTFAVDERLLDALWMERCPVLEPLRARPDFAVLRSRVRERAREAMRGLHDPSS